MAINFENVIGNQTSANVLAQINNNFAKINSTPVPKADLATNADMVDNKHASDLIPGAATFVSSITTLTNLEVGRYFCTQARQSWEPVATTGTRTFLIEVSLNVPNALKSYKITYITGAGAGESYYTDYGSGGIRWNRIINNNNVQSIDAVKNTYDENDISGRVTTYNDMIVYKEDDKNIVEGAFISANDGTGNYYQFSMNCSFSHTSGSGCSVYYYWNISGTIRVYNSSFGLIRTVTSPSQTLQAGYGNTASGTIIGYLINQNTGDVIFTGFGTCYSNNNYSGNVRPDGYYYYSTATNSVIFVPYSGAIIIDMSYRNSMVVPDYWYNNHFGFFKNQSNNMYLYYIELNANRNGIVANSNINIVGGINNYNLVGQKGQYFYICTNSSSTTSQPSLIKIDLTNRSTQSTTIAISSTTQQAAYCSGSIVDNNNIYLVISYRINTSQYHFKIVKYTEALVLAGTSPEFINDYSVYIILTDNYVVSFSTNVNSTFPSVCFSKSNLGIISSYVKPLYLGGVYNPTGGFGSNYLTWWKQEYRNFNVNAIPLGGDYVLGAKVVNYYNGDATTSYGSVFQLYPIILVSNGNTVGYFANILCYSQSTDKLPNFIDGLGVVFRGKKLLTNNPPQYLLKSFKRN